MQGILHRYRQVSLLGRDIGSFLSRTWSLIALGYRLPRNWTGPASDLRVFHILRSPLRGRGIQNNRLVISVWEHGYFRLTCKQRYRGCMKAIIARAKKKISEVGSEVWLTGLEDLKSPSAALKSVSIEHSSIGCRPALLKWTLNNFGSSRLASTRPSMFSITTWNQGLPSLLLDVRRRLMILLAPVCRP